MKHSKQILFAKWAVVLATPAIILAFSMGPPPRATGAPGDATCAQAGCHVGTAVGNQVRIEFVDGSTTYTPGETKRMRVTISDATSRYGFQSSARLLSNLQNGQAGTFRPVDGTTQVICEDSSPRPSGGSCRATAPLEFIEHSSPRTTGNFEFEWVAPATDVGQVRFYVAGNAANGNGVNTGDRIHTAEFTVSPAAGGTPPSINSGGVVNGASFQSGIVSGSWVSIFGSNFSTSRKDWNVGPDGVFPTEIDGVRVNINNKPAFINLTMPGQINVQAPDDTATGIVNVEVITPAGRAAATANLEPVRPGLFATQVDTRRYVAATIGGIFIGNPADVPGTRPARPGEIIELWGTGFGATQPTHSAGRVVAPPYPIVATTVRVRVGGVEVIPEFAGLVIAGVYQVNIRVPETLANGSHAVSIIVGGIESANNGNLFVQRP